MTPARQLSLIELATRYDQGDCMKETTKDVVLLEASKPADSTPDAPRNAQQELVGVLCGGAGPAHASLPVSVG